MRALLSLTWTFAFLLIASQPASAASQDQAVVAMKGAATPSRDTPERTVTSSIPASRRP